jgi:hypothetical protein
MSIRSTVIAAIVAVAICPALSRAASDDPSLTACAKDFAAGLDAHGIAPAGGYRITFLNRGYVETEAEYEAGISKYDLVAREMRSGVALASATCTVDEHGAVSASSYVPLTVAVPALAASR